MPDDYTPWDTVESAPPAYDLYLELQQKRRDMNTCVRMLRETGTELAEAERAYRVRLRAETLALRDEGMAVTLIRDVVRGIDEVANLRFERDRAQVTYDANKDALNAIKLEIRVIENQIAREYSNPMLGTGSL